MKYGEELIRELEAEIERYENQMSRRWDRINNGETDQEDCFVSMRVEECKVVSVQILHGIWKDKQTSRRNAGRYSKMDTGNH